MKGQASFLPVVIGIIIVVGLAAVVILNHAPQVDASQLKKFSSVDEIEKYISTSSDNYGMPYFGGDMARQVAAPMMTTGVAEDSAAGSGEKLGGSDYSGTNVQVQGVDEADIVKTDGKYMYVVSNNKVFIVDAYPADGAEIISEIDPEGSVSEIFVNGDKLVLFGQKMGEYVPIREKGTGIAMPMYEDGYYYSEEAYTKIYDISDKTNPELVRDLEINGSYYDSRMIGDYVYIIMNSPVNHDHIIIPLVYQDGRPLRSPGVFPEVYYFDNPDYSYRFTTVMSVNTQNDAEEPNSEIYMMGYTQNMYVSQDHIYVTYQKNFPSYVFYDRIIDDVILPLTPMTVESKINSIRNSDLSTAAKMAEVSSIFETYFNGLSETEKEQLTEDMQGRMEDVQKELAKEMEKTYIHKINVQSGEITYKAEGNVPGHLLNQFSMDQDGSYFRVATTTGQTWDGTSANNVYVLDSELNIVGELEDLAPGESIYSVRFMGDRAYMVTFKKIDPLFVIDLSSPTNPAVLGKLKIPGYSDYLHPYDENHIIGIGKDAVDAEDGLQEARNLDFAWYQGLKIALFDVTDVENPVEMYKIVIGDRGTDSPALHDHKAFLFSKDKSLLVVPVLLAEIKDKENVVDWSYGDYVYQGAYVYDLTLENGFDLKGRITHFDNNDDFIKSGYYFGGGDYSIMRSLYINDILYTISTGKVMANSLDGLSEVASIELK